jgi:hypothetical protein
MKSDIENFNEYLIKEFEDHSIGINNTMGDNVIVEYNKLSFVFNGDTGKFIGLWKNNIRIF